MKCNSRSSDSLTKTCFVITIVSLFQIDKKVMLDSKYKERQKYMGSVEQEMEKDPSLQMKKQPLRIKTVYFCLMPLMISGVST